MYIYIYLYALFRTTLFPGTQVERDALVTQLHTHTHALVFVEQGAKVVSTYIKQ